MIADRRNFISQAGAFSLNGLFNQLYAETIQKANNRSDV